MFLLGVLAACMLAASLMALSAVMLSSRLSQNESELLGFPDEESAEQPFPFPETHQPPL